MILEKDESSTSQLKKQNNFFFGIGSAGIWKGNYIGSWYDRGLIDAHTSIPFFLYI